MHRRFHTKLLFYTNKNQNKKEVSVCNVKITSFYLIRKKSNENTMISQVIHIILNKIV